MIDLTQTNVAVLNATCSSLVLIDEFGKGTCSTDGIGLFCAVMEHFGNKGMDCPKVIAATHFHEIYSRKLLNLKWNWIMRDMTMQIMKEQGLVFLYKAIDGRGNESHGMYCASLAGIPSLVIERGREWSRKIALGMKLI